MTDITKPIETLRPDEDLAVKPSGLMDTVKRVLYAMRFAEGPKSSTTPRDPDYVSPTIMFGVIGTFAMLMTVNKCH